ncbi:MAG: hypothetical protein KBE65_23810 [Phycisphaerae bacterium]|nr:hypothetical protein [Phycisphaerae bacterium]
MRMTRCGVALTTWLLLITLCLYSSSCAGLVTRQAYEGPKRPDTETARVEVESQHGEGTGSSSSIGAVNNMDWRGLVLAVRVLPGPHDFYVVTDRITSTVQEVPTITPQSTKWSIITYRWKYYCTKVVWKVTFDVAAGSKYRIVSSGEGYLPPEVFICDAAGKDTKVIAPAERFGN